MKSATQNNHPLHSRSPKALSTPAGKLCMAAATIMLFSFGTMAYPLLAVSNSLAYYQGFLMLIAPLSTLSFCMSLFSLYLIVTHISGHQRRIPDTALSVSIPLEATSDVVSKSNDSGHCFQQAVLAAAQEFSLTKRETEVFDLLMQGRNAERISKALVISKHTSKSHIYRIYRKTNTSSHQDLLDLFEREFQKDIKSA